MSIPLQANLNERAQITFDVAGFASVYPGLASASWRMQIRPFQGSPTLLFDFAASGVITYIASPLPVIVFQAATSTLAQIPPGAASYEFGFVLPGADYEVAGYGPITFYEGVVQAGVAGTPGAPPLADDTWLGGVNPTPSPVPPTLTNAIAIATQASADAVAAAAESGSASAIAAAASATSASASAATATSEATAADGSALAAAGSATSATSSATAASASAASASSFASGASASAIAAALSATAAAASAASVSSTVLSLAALEALAIPANGVSVLMTAPLTFGLFTFTTTDQSAAVSNDIVQAITVAPSSDPSGASGAWVRQDRGATNLGWFGVIGDATFTYASPLAYAPPISYTGTDNSGALAAFGMWARWQSSLGNTVHVSVPPGKYLFDLFKCWFFNANIKRLIWDNNGAFWQNISATAGVYMNQPWPQSCAPLRNFPANVAQSWPINQTVPGAYAFSLVNPSDAANLTVDKYIMLSSLDTAYFGYPPTAQNFEFVKIFQINSYAAATPTSIAYSTNTGITSMTFAVAPFGAGVASTINGAGLALSGTNQTALNGTWPVASTSSNGTVINLQTPLGLGALTVTGGTIAASAIVGLFQSIRYKHLPTYPDDSIAVANYPVGAARVWNMDTGAYTITGPNPAFSQSVPIITWDVDQEYNDMDVGAPPLGGIELYWTVSGRRIITRKWKGTGFSESVAGQIIHESPTLLIPGQPDKLVDSLEYKNLNHSSSIGLTTPGFAGIGFESPFNRVRMTGSKISGGLGIGSVINFYADNCDFDSFAYGGNLGFSNGPVLVGCRIGNPNNKQLSFVDGSTVNTIDGATDVWFGTAGPGASSAPGVITVFKTVKINAAGAWTTSNNTINMSASNPGSVLAGQKVTDNTTGLVIGTVLSYVGTLLTLATNAASASHGSSDSLQFGQFTLGLGTWSAVPGMTVNLAANVSGASLFTGVTGNGVVLNVFEDATYVYIVTTLPFATLPAWSNNNIYMFRATGAKFIRCSGSDTIRQASVAFDKGKEYWEYKQYLLGGAYSASLLSISQVYGNLTKVTVTPFQVGVSPGATLTLQFATYDSTNNFVADTFPGLRIVIAVGIAGQRIVTQGAFTGNQSGDGVSVGGGSLSVQPLPAHRVVGGFTGASFTMNTSGATLSNWQSPMVDIELEFDCGIARKLVPVGYDTGGNVTFGISGSMP